MPAASAFVGSLHDGAHMDIGTNDLTQEELDKLASLGVTDYNVQWWRISDIHRYQNNPRKNDHAVDKVAQAILEFGWRQHIVTDADRVIVVGDTRYMAAIKLGYPAVPVMIARNLTADQIRAYRVADNRVGEEAEWDDAKLIEELIILNEHGVDLVQLTGFDEDEVARLLSQPDTPEGEHTETKLGVFNYQIVVSCGDEETQANLCEELEKRGLSCRLLTL